MWILCVAITCKQGFPGGSDSRESAYSAGGLGLIPGSGRSPGEGDDWLPTPVFLPGEFHGQRNEFMSLALVWWDEHGLISVVLLLLPNSYDPWDHKESDMTERLTHTHTHRKPRSGYLSITTAMSLLCPHSWQNKEVCVHIHICKFFCMYPSASLLS